MANPQPLTPVRSVTRRHTVTEAQITAYLELSGDRNPIHLDDSLAQQHGFPQRLAYGMFLGLLLPRIFAEVLDPGPFLCLSQTFRFPKPVFIGDTVEFTVSVAHRMEAAGISLLEITAKNQNGEVVLTGDARVLELKIGGNPK